jgi:hypothetical protein
MRMSEISFVMLSERTSVRSIVDAATMLCGLMLASRLRPQTQSANPLAQLRWRFVGHYGNRAIAVVREPGNSMVASGRGRGRNMEDRERRRGLETSLRS